MFSFLKRVLFFKIKVIFKNPEKKNLLVFDCDSSFDLKYILLDYNYFTLQVRKEKINDIYLSLKIILKIFKNYQGNLMSAYLISLIEIVNPKVIVSTIDNSLKLSEICKNLYKKINFISIQNASRYDIKINKYFYDKKILNFDLNKNYFTSNFFCFGQYEIDHYKKYNLEIKKFYPAGSLRLSNFFNYLKVNKIKIRKNFYDICLISDACPGTDKLFNDYNMEKGFAKVAQYTIRFCIKHNFRFIFAAKRAKYSKSFDNELNFYKKYLTVNEFKYLMKHKIDRDMENFSSYRLAYESKIVVANRSTLLKEKLCTGGKILSVNLTRSDLWNFHIKGICSMNYCSYEQFEKRLLYIKKIGQKIYLRKIKKGHLYYMNYNRNISTIKKVKDKIDILLK
jgi:surface carbohydrate biosynthesis protein